MLNPPVKGKIQGLYKAFECFSCTFQGKFNFQGLFNASTFQACANPEDPDQPAHLPSLISTFAISYLESIVVLLAPCSNKSL